MNKKPTFDLRERINSTLSFSSAPAVQMQEGGAANKLQQKMGYKDNSPYKNLPYQDIYSDRITMSGVSRPLVATTDTGVRTVMQPGGEYYFPGATQVRETPLYSNGGGIKDRENFQTMKLNTYTTPLSKLTGISTPKFQNSGRTSSNNQAGTIDDYKPQNENQMWIKAMIGFEKKRGMPGGKPHTRYGINDENKYGKGSPTSLGDAVQRAEKYLISENQINEKDAYGNVKGIDLNKLPLKIRQRVGDYRFNSGRNARHLLLYAAGLIELDDINDLTPALKKVRIDAREGRITQAQLDEQLKKHSDRLDKLWKENEAEVFKRINNNTNDFADKIDTARDDIFRTTKATYDSNYNIIKSNPDYTGTVAEPGRRIVTKEDVYGNKRRVIIDANDREIGEAVTGAWSDRVKMWKVYDKIRETYENPDEVVSDLNLINVIVDKPNYRDVEGAVSSVASQKNSKRIPLRERNEAQNTEAQNQGQGQNQPRFNVINPGSDRVEQLKKEKEQLLKQVDENLGLNAQKANDARLKLYDVNRELNKLTSGQERAVKIGGKDYTVGIAPDGTNYVFDGKNYYQLEKTFGITSAKEADLDFLVKEGLRSNIQIHNPLEKYDRENPGQAPFKPTQVTGSTGGQVVQPPVSTQVQGQGQGQVQGQTGTQGGQGTGIQGTGTNVNQGSTGAQGGTGSQAGIGQTGTQGNRVGTQGATSQGPQTGIQGNQGSTGAQGGQGSQVNQQGTQQGTAQGPQTGVQQGTAGVQGGAGNQGGVGSTGAQGGTGNQVNQGQLGTVNSPGATNQTPPTFKMSGVAPSENTTNVTLYQTPNGVNVVRDSKGNVFLEKDGVATLALDTQNLFGEDKDISKYSNQEIVNAFKSKGGNSFVERVYKEESDSPYRQINLAPYGKSLAKGVSDQGFIDLPPKQGETRYKYRFDTTVPEYEGYSVFDTENPDKGWTKIEDLDSLKKVTQNYAEYIGGIVMKASNDVRKGSTVSSTAGTNTTGAGKDEGDYINLKAKDKDWDYRYNTQTNQWEVKRKKENTWIKVDDTTEAKRKAKPAIEAAYRADLDAELAKREKAAADKKAAEDAAKAGGGAAGGGVNAAGTNAGGGAEGNTDGTTTTTGGGQGKYFSPDRFYTSPEQPKSAWWNRPTTETSWSKLFEQQPKNQQATQVQTKGVNTTPTTKTGAVSTGMQSNSTNPPSVETDMEGMEKTPMQRNIDKFLEERATAEKSKANIQEIQRKRQALEQLGLPPEFTNTDNTTPTQSRPTTQIPALPNRSMLAITPQNRRQISAPPLNIQTRSTQPQTNEETQPQTEQKYQAPTFNMLNPYQYENPRENVSIYQTNDGINVVRDNQGRVFLEKGDKSVPLSSNTEGRLGESNEEILNQISSDPSKIDSYLKDVYNKGLTDYYKPKGEVYGEINYPSLNRDVYGYPEIGSEEHNKMIDEYEKSINEYAKKYGVTAVKKQDRRKIDTSSLPNPPSSNTDTPPYVNGGQIQKFNVGGGISKGVGTGATLGAALGTVVPGIGNVVGGAVGAIVGGIAGGISGASKANKAKREARRQELLQRQANQSSSRQSNLLGLVNMLGSGNNSFSSLLSGPNFNNMQQGYPMPNNYMYTPRMSQLMPPPFQEGAQVEAPIYTNETPPQVYSTGLNREQLQTPGVKPTLLDMQPLKKEKDAQSSQSAAGTQAGTGQRIITIKDEDGTPKRVLVDSAGNVIRFIDQPMSEQQKLDMSYSQGIDYAISARNYVEEERKRRAAAALAQGQSQNPPQQQQGGPIITSLLYRNMDKNNSIKNNISMNKSKLESVINLSSKVNPYRLSPMGVYKNGGLIMEGGVSASRAGFSRQPITGASSTGPLGPKRSEVPSYTNKGVNSIMDLPTNEYVSTENMIPIQAEIGEMIVLPTGDLMPVMARRRHHQMQDDEVTDMTPENSYILSAHGQVRINKDEADLLITETGVKPYRLGQSQNPPTEKTLASVMTKRVMRPAEVAKRINSLFPVLSTDNPFEIAANIENKINRKPYLEGLIQLSELDKYRKGLSEPAMSDLQQQQMQMPQQMPGSPMLARQGRRISRPGVVRAQDSLNVGNFPQNNPYIWRPTVDQQALFPPFPNQYPDSTVQNAYTLAELQQLAGSSVVAPRTDPYQVTPAQGDPYGMATTTRTAPPAQNQNSIFSGLSAPANFAARLIGSQAMRNAERAGIARERGIYDQGFGRMGNLMTAGTAAEAAMLGAQDPFVKWRDIPDTYIRSARTQTPGQVLEAQSAAAFANMPQYGEMGQAGLAAQNAAYARGLEQSSKAMMDTAERDRAAFNVQQQLLQQNLAGNVAGRLAAERATTAAINKMLSGYGSLANRYAQGQIDLTGQRMGANIGLSRAEQASKTGLYQNRLNAFTTFTGDMAAGGEDALKALLGFGG